MRKRHVVLRRRMIQVLKETARPMTAVQMMDLLLDTGLSGSYIGSRSRVAEVLRTTPGIKSRKHSVKGIGHNSYLADTYSLDNEDDFVRWLER